MASCENNTGINYWLGIPAKDLASWMELLKEQQESIRQAIKKASKSK